jgi:hypothetical protein
MGIFDSIKNAIFGSAEAAPADKPAPAPTAPPKPSAPAAAGKPASAAKPAPAPTAPPKPSATAAAAKAPVDVAAVLDAAVAKKGQKLDWRHSIVDLMKALDLDSSLGARKELAKELGYTGDMGDSATMNIWLHKQLMQKLKDNGGTVPADLTA